MEQSVCLFVMLSASIKEDAAASSMKGGNPMNREPDKITIALMIIGLIIAVVLTNVVANAI
jgi:hypothetical protein